MKKTNDSGFRNWSSQTKVIMRAFFCVLVLWASGCNMEQPGETTAEGRRRHVRRARINHQEMWQDIDRIMLTERPSELTDKKLP